MTEPTHVLADRWKRLGGALIDSLIAMAISFPVMLVGGVFRQIMEGERMTLGQQLFFFVFGLVVFLAVNGYLLAKQGQTVGKRLVGTRIVSHENGQILPFGRVFGLRYLPLFLISQVPFLGSLFALVDVLFIFREDHRCVHDLIAGTHVVEA